LRTIVRVKKRFFHGMTKGQRVNMEISSFQYHLKLQKIQKYGPPAC
jgi:hypothetical protein